MSNMPEVKRKPHCVEVRTASLSEKDGEVWLNQEVILREYAFDEPELIDKSFKVNGKIVPASFEAMRELADESIWVDADNKPVAKGKK